MARCVEFQQFDSDVFGCPFYRVTEFSPPDFEKDIRRLIRSPPIIIDAKIRADLIDLAESLLCIGFRKVCTQVELRHDLQMQGSPSGNAAIETRVEFSDEAVAAHAANFIFDRFALDVAIPREAHDRLYRRWIRNSLHGPDHKVVREGLDFITFREVGDSFKIDLVSVLDKGRGVATKLLNTIIAEAKLKEKRCVTATTECENFPSINTYLKIGFSFRTFHSIFHYVQT